MRSIASVVLLSAFVAQTAVAQPRKKQVKDQAEHELYNQAINADDAARQIEALDAWARKYPDSEYKDDRLYMYMQAFNKLSPPQPLKVIEHGARLMSANLHRLFNSPEGGLVIVNILFLVARNVASLAAPTAEQLALGEKAARDLLLFLSEHKPADTAESEWVTARADIEKRTQAALIAMVMAPGGQAMAKNPPDCEAAATAWSKAIADYPRDAMLAYSLGKALSCQGRIPQAIYQFVRAAELDPSLGGSADAMEVANYASRLYISYHGGDEGLDRLRNQVKDAPLPAGDVGIETAADVAARKQSDFARNNPQAALWMGIKEHLSGANASQYFEGQLKNTAVLLKGAVVEGRPSCRPKELLVAIEPATVPEILIRLDSPLAGTAVPGEIEFDAIPRAFTQAPLSITMDAARIKIKNLKIGPCPPK